jgi:outer membrane receptor for ferrienterochelin and colicins
MHATQTEASAQGDLETRGIEFAPRLSAIFTANYQFDKIGLSVGYTFRYTGNMLLPEVYDLDSEGNPLLQSRSTESQAFVIHSLQLTKQLKSNFSIYGGIDNILDYIQPISPLTGYNDPTASPGFSSYFDTSYAFAPIHGREFYLGVKWDLNR